MTRAIAVALLCLFAWAATADAKPRHKIVRADSAVADSCVLTNEGHKICSGAVQAPSDHARVTVRHEGGKATTSRECLTPDTRLVLDRAEAHFGTKFTLVSTCRPGAIIAGTDHISEHAHNRAVDLLVPRSISKAEVVRWLFENAKGVTMTYRNMAHVHFDTGPYHALACGGCGKPRHIRLAHNFKHGAMRQSDD